ncbi:jg3143, partial [Pararge aegeria aegeria]
TDVYYTVGGKKEELASFNKCSSVDEITECIYAFTALSPGLIRLLPEPLRGSRTDVFVCSPPTQLHLLVVSLKLPFNTAASLRR